MSDRVVVMHERCIKGVLPRAAATQDRIGSLMTGRDIAVEPTATAVTARALEPAVKGPHGQAHAADDPEHEGRKVPE